jgi:hypothetical protein
MKALILALLTALSVAAAETPSVTVIMGRVGDNQEAAREARRAYLYRQQQVVRMHRANGKLAREERIDYQVTPGQLKVEKQQTNFQGKYELKGKFVPYDHSGYQYKDLDIDGDLIQDIEQDLMDDQSARDGIAADLFPLLPQEQWKYDFKLMGTETYRGHSVYRVTFHPRPRINAQGDVAAWKGEALIDAEEFQPVMVTTSLAEKIPVAVKLLLGTDVKGLGFQVTYQKFGEGVWFPVSYGGEFEVRGLFFYKRAISVSMVNSDFRRTDVNSTVVYATDAH